MDLFPFLNAHGSCHRYISVGYAVSDFHDILHIEGLCQTHGGQVPMAVMKTNTFHIPTNSNKRLEFVFISN